MTSKIERAPFRRTARAETAGDAARVVVENVNRPGEQRDVDAGKYEAMRAAVLAVLPPSSPGMSLSEVFAALLPQLPQALFPAGAHAPWWFKIVQLDLEAKGLVIREHVRPLRIHRAPPVG